MGSAQALYRPLRLPGIEIPGNILLAPLAGYTDAAFRIVCLEAGASMAFTEMVSCEALARDREGRKSLEIARRAEGERLLAIQLFGANPESASRAVERLLPLGPALLDLNCGCSVPKVLRSGSGAALLRDPDLIERMVAAMVAASGLPVSVKLRSGWDAENVNYLTTAAAAVSGGACLVTLHPRTRAQGFTGRAEWPQIAALKRSVSVPVLASGDLLDAGAIRAMMVETGCDGLMIARGAIGNPFVFAAARAALEGREPPPPPTTTERLEAAVRHLDLAVATRGEKLACREMRKHLHSYIHGVPGSVRLRRIFSTATTRAQLVDAVDAFLVGGPEHTDTEVP